MQNQLEISTVQNYPSSVVVARREISWGFLILWGALFSILGTLGYLGYHGYRQNGVTFRDVVRSIFVGVVFWIFWTMIFCAAGR
jgi:RsiW-degrading membrane proteinase PrsW (M82 family)